MPYHRKQLYCIERELFLFPACPNGFGTLPSCCHAAEASIITRLTKWGFMFCSSIFNSCSVHMLTCWRVHVFKPCFSWTHEHMNSWTRERRYFRLKILLRHASILSTTFCLPWTPSCEKGSACRSAGTATLSGWKTWPFFNPFSAARSLANFSSGAAVKSPSLSNERWFLQAPFSPFRSWAFSQQPQEYILHYL